MQTVWIKWLYLEEGHNIKFLQMFCSEVAQIVTF